MLRKSHPALSIHLSFWWSVGWSVRWPHFTFACFFCGLYCSCPNALMTSNTTCDWGSRVTSLALCILQPNFCRCLSNHPIFFDVCHTAQNSPTYDTSPRFLQCMSHHLGFCKKLISPLHGWLFAWLAFCMVSLLHG